MPSSTAAFDMNEFLSSCWGHTSFTHHVLNDYIETSTVPHVMEFTDECLTVFGSMSMHRYAFIFGYMMTGSRQYCIQTYTFSKWHLTKRVGDMYENLYVCWYATAFQRIFSPLTWSILKTIINLQKLSVQSCHHRHKGSYTRELHCLLLQPWRQPYPIRLIEDIDACGMVVHSRLYIPVSNSIYHSLLNLAIISPALYIADPHTWALICCF